MWTLEQELCAVASTQTLSVALKRLGLCRSDDAPGCEVSVRRDWVRSGAETYALIGQIDHSDGRTTPVFVKACVAIGDLSGVEKVAATWLKRRAHLRENGISTPHLFGFRKATFLEEYVPVSFWDAIRDANRRTAILDSLGATLGTLTRLGYPCLNIADWRSRGTDAVIVDFGEDLGGPELVDPSNMGTLEDALNLIDQQDVRLTPQDLQCLSASFEVGLSNHEE